MVKKIFVQVYYKLIWYLYQIKNKLIFLVSAKKFIHGDLNECQKKILKILLVRTILLLQV